MRVSSGDIRHNGTFRVFLCNTGNALNTEAGYKAQSSPSQPLAKRVIRWLLDLPPWQFVVIFVIAAVLISMLIVVNIDLLWDGHFDAELEFAGVFTPFVDSLLLVLLVNATLNEIRSEVNRRKQVENEIRILATTDALTGVNNRRQFSTILAQEVDRSLRYGNTLSLIMYDIDHFKQINDTCGHDVGDLVLKEVTALVKTNTRSVDVLARWGGEEFMIIMPQSPIDAAKSAAEKLRAAIAEGRFSKVNNTITASFGVTCFQPPETLDSFLKRVDDATYKAKRNGRNQIEVLIDERARTPDKIN